MSNNKEGAPHSALKIVKCKLSCNTQCAETNIKTFVFYTVVDRKIVCRSYMDLIQEFLTGGQCTPKA